MRRRSVAARLGVAAVWSGATFAVLAFALEPCVSAEIRVVTSGAPARVQEKLAPKFAETTGHRASIAVGTLRVVRGKLAAGEKADAVVLPVPAIEALTKAGVLRAGSRVELARVGIGVAVRAGAKLPDISTVEAIRRMLLDARSIAHPDPKGGGFAGAHIARMMERIGIADAVKPKVTLAFAIAGGVASVAKGDAEVGLFNISEILPVKGVALVGPLPAELQNYIVFAGAIHSGSTAPDAALAYLKSLADPNARDAWKAGGFEALRSAP